MLASDPLPQIFVTNQLLLILSPAVLILIILLLLLLSALLSASEVAFFSLSPQDLEELEADESREAKILLELKAIPRKLLATILISNNFINIAIVIISEVFLRTLFSEASFQSWAEFIISNLSLSIFSVSAVASALSFFITVVIVTFLLVLFGEVAPKIYANLNNVNHAKLMSRPLMFLSKALGPFNTILIKTFAKIEERVYHKRLYSSGVKNKKEIDKAIELTVTEGENQDEVDILKGIIKFGDVVAKQIMKPRPDVTSIDADESFEDVLKTVRESGFSRIPVQKDSFDNIVGILYAKDLLGYTNKKDFDWFSIVRKNVLFVPESKKIDDLLEEFQQKRTHIAIVVDEYGGTSGIATLEDVMEEVLGDIRDEFDVDEEVDYIRIDEKNYVFEAKTLLNDIVRIISLPDELFDEYRGAADSLAGLILEIEGVIPKVDSEISYKNLKFKILSVSKRRIEKVNISL